MAAGAVVAGVVITGAAVVGAGRVDWVVAGSAVVAGVAVVTGTPGRVLGVTFVDVVDVHAPAISNTSTTKNLRM